MVSEVAVADDEVVGGHAYHVGLDDGLEAQQHTVGALGVGAEQVVFLQGVEDIVVEAGGLVAVEEECIVAFDVLVDAAGVVDGPGGLVGVEDVFAEGREGLVVAEDAEDGGHDVDLLHDAGAFARGEFAGGVVDGDGDGEDAHRGLAFFVLGLRGVVGGEDEDGVFEPGLPGGSGEEVAEGIVAVLDGAVDVERTAGVDGFVAFGDVEGVVGGGGEETGHEGFREPFGDGGGGELEEVLVPDGPVAVEVGASAGARIVAVFGHAYVVFESRRAGEGLEAHGGVGGAVASMLLRPLAKVCSKVREWARSESRKGV